jgi:dolichol-phosphate mannosyltransferase
MSKQPRISVLISCFNEEANIADCVRRVAAALPEAEIVVVHGGDDRTLEVARGLTDAVSNLVLVRNENDRGKGHGIRTGIQHASANVMAQFDADLQFFATDLPALVDPVLKGDCDLCLGSRFLPSSNRSAYRTSFFRDVGNRVLSGLVSILIGCRVTDATAGIKAWTRDAIRQIDYRDDRYSYEAEIVIRAGALGLRIQEVPVSYASRRKGNSQHANTADVIKAGIVIMAKSIACRIRTGDSGGNGP